MARHWNNIIVVETDDLVPQFYTNAKSLSNAAKIAERRGYGLKRVQKGGRNHPALFDYDTLPPHIQNQIPDPRKGLHILEQFYTTDPDAVDFYQKYQFEDDSYIADHIQERYITNASMLRALQQLRMAREEARIKMGGSLKGVMSSLCSDAITFAPILQKKWNVSHTLPTHPTRFRQLYSKFRTDGYPCLISKLHKNTNSRKVDEYLVELLNNMFATQSNKPSITDVARQYDAFLSGYLEVINQESGEVYNPSDFKAISQGTIYNYLSEWKSRIGTATYRQGNRQVLMGQFKPYHSLQQPTMSGSIISIDDRQPPFEYAKGKRMWFYNAIDLASEAFTTWVYGKSKEGIIIDFYRQMVRNYTDWGMEIPAEVECESSLNSSFRDTFLKEGNMFQTVRMEANNARGKRIEQYYRPLRYGIEKKSEGWLARPFAISETNQAGAFDVPMIPYSDLVDARLRDIETWNNMPHSKYPDKCRWEVFVERQNPNLKPTNWRGILPYLGHKTTTSCKLGIIKLQRREWLLGQDDTIATGQTLINLMDKVEGRNVDVYWLDGNDGDVLKALVYVGDQYICEALAKPTYNRARIEQTSTDMEARELMSSYVATIEAYQKTQRRGIERVAVIDHTPERPKAFVMPKLRKETRPWGEEPVEVLPEPEEEDLSTISKGFKTSLKDRF